MNQSANKIKTWEEAQVQVNEWRKAGEEIVFTNGCFDILHLGHVDYLEKSSHFGSKLVIGVNSDSSVSKLKGPSRPINDEYARARLLAALGFVDLVVVFSEDTPLDLIKYLLPTVLVKGSDYSVETIVGAKEVMENGGKVETIDLVQGYSTTNIIEKSKNNQ